MNFLQSLSVAATADGAAATDEVSAFARWFAIGVFLVAMTLIVSEKVHRTIVAIVGAVLVQMAHIVSFESAIHHVDWNTLGVLLGMMLFVAVVKESGLFEFLAIKTAKIAKGNPWRIMMLFMILTAVLSAFLDNVTTVLLIGPMTLTICELLDEDPIPFFLMEIIASNVGGTATLIGDPPNIMIGSKAVMGDPADVAAGGGKVGLGFADFIMYDGPIVIVLMAVLIGIAYVMYGRKMSVSAEKQELVMELEPNTERAGMMKLSVGMLLAVVIAFMAHGALGLESSVIALAAGGLALLLNHKRVDIHTALHGVEWTTLIFFGGLFIIVGAMVDTGTIKMLGNALVGATGGNVFATMLILVFASAVISAFLDNIPFVATMIPILTGMASQMDGDIAPLWWALSLGACLGGNGSLIGASANVVLSDISTKNGHPITFMRFTKVGFPIMLVTVALSAVYLVILDQLNLF